MKDLFYEYKEKICPHCIHYNNKDYLDCNIVIQIDGQATCKNYKCKDYCRKKKKNEIKNK